MAFRWNRSEKRNYLWGGGAFCVDSLSNYLFVGGQFDTAGNVLTKDIAIWNGINWLPVSPDCPFDGVASMAFLNGKLYVSTTVNSNPTNKVAVWDGTSWSFLPSFNPGNSTVWCLSVINGELYAGGDFYKSGSTILHGIAKWNGSSWQALGGGLAGCAFCPYTVYSIEEYNGKVAVGGNFIAIGTDTVNNIALWNGSSWEGLDGGLIVPTNSFAGIVWDMLADNSDLYVAGRFTITDSGLYVRGIARWDGNSWHNLGYGCYGIAPSCLLVNSYHDTIIALGAFSPNLIQRNTYWNGTEWKYFDHFINSGAGNLKIFNNELYMGLGTTPAGTTDSGSTEILHGIARLGVITFQSITSTCSVGCNGTASANPVGVPPHTYLWSNGQTTQTATGLCLGNYTVTVTDASGNPTVGSVTINGPPVVSYNHTSTNASCYACNDGSAQINITTGNIAHLQWNTGDTTFSISGQLTGNYIVALTDSVGCVQYDTVTIAYNAAAQTTGQDATCNNACNGNATATSNGLAPFTFNWGNGATTQTINNLCAGIYIVTVTDSNGVSAASSVIIDEPTAIVNSVLGINNTNCYTCNTGSSIANPSGGTPNYTYLWSNGETTQTATALYAGTNYVTVTDSNGCLIIDIVVINYNCIANATSQDPLCYKVCTGVASATSDGLAPFTYQWSTGDTTQSIDSLCGGIYEVTVIDSNGIAATDTVLIVEPPELEITDTTSNASCQTCSNGSAGITATGGTPPFAFLWSNGATTQTADSLTAGTYYVTVTDDNGCERIDTVIIDFDSGINSFTIHPSQFTIFPNPVSEELTIQLNSSCTDCKLEITNTIGVKIISQEIISPITQLNIKSLPSGIYFIKLQTQSGETQVKKFVKQ